MSWITPAGATLSRNLRISTLSRQDLVLSLLLRKRSVPPAAGACLGRLLLSADYHQKSQWLRGASGMTSSGLYAIGTVRTREVPSSMGRHRSNVSARTSAGDTFPAETRFSYTTTELK